MHQYAYAFQVLYALYMQIISRKWYMQNANALHYKFVCITYAPPTLLTWTQLFSSLASLWVQVVVPPPWRRPAPAASGLGFWQLSPAAPGPRAKPPCQWALSGHHANIGFTEPRPWLRQVPSRIIRTWSASSHGDDSDVDRACHCCSVTVSGGQGYRAVAFHWQAWVSVTVPVTVAAE